MENIPVGVGGVYPDAVAVRIAMLGRASRVSIYLQYELNSR